MVEMLVVIAYLIPVANTGPSADLTWDRPPAAVPANWPTWQPGYADRFPGCVSGRAWGRRHQGLDALASVPDGYLIVGQDGRPRRLGFHRTHTVTHNANPADDVWVVGWCTSR